tara:strand:+ start:64738 stop:66747 length:2010 start_codon:yes stop_codon:yes gene_type:complete
MPSRQDRANAIRFLSIDAVQQANSGHPGMPMGMADMAEVLWHDHLRHNPKNPNWLNRDRFVLSNGHGSMLLYSLLHLSGYDLSMDDLKNFRQWHSKTPGHPELGYAPGIETTTGPLGQGVSNAVGMALAEKMLAEHFNRDDLTIVDHFTYTFLGDGCLMEGISHETCALAGTWELGKLICFWDDNGISIDGKTTGWFTDDTAKRFEAYGWHVIRDIDGHDADAVNAAIIKAKKEHKRPSLICCKTQIGYGSPKVAGTASAHGAPLGDDEIAQVRKQLQWDHKPFEIPQAICDSWSAVDEGASYESEWQQLFAAYQAAHPELALEFTRRMSGELPADWQKQVAAMIAATNTRADNPATRKGSLNCLNVLAPALPELLGGSADLSGSNCTKFANARVLTEQVTDADYIHYGVREFGMCAIMNGLALHGGYIPFGGTFLVFSDYARNAIRMAAIMKQRVIYVLSHDSIGLGEDGPTHQPIEHTSSLRLIPNLHVWRPCDEVETAVMWQSAIEEKATPSALLLTRQSLPHQMRDTATVENIKRGGYILKDCDGEPDMILIATGSEVQLAMQAAEQLDAKVRVVSMPCAELFLLQDADYRESVFPCQVTNRIAIEAGVTDYWYRFVGLEGKVVGIDHYGESAPANILFNEFGFTVDNIVEQAKELLGEEVCQSV